MRWFALALFALALVAVTAGSLVSAGPSMNVSHADKVQHFGAYALLAALAFAACRERSWPVAAALVGLGVALEVAQWALGTGREPSALDAAANAAGVLVVSLAWRGR